MLCYTMLVLQSLPLRIGVFSLTFKVVLPVVNTPSPTASGLDEVNGITGHIRPVCWVELHFTFLHPRQDLLVFFTSAFK